MNKKSKYLYFIVTLLFFIVFDMYFSNVLLKSRFSLEENSLIDIIYVQNTGAAFSILENSTLFLIIFGIAAVMLLLFYGFKHVEKFSTFACLWFAMLISGISCNLYERIAYGYVRDFFKLNFVDFPVFNISDIFINVGVIALIIIIIKNKYLKNEKLDN